MGVEIIDLVELARQEKASKSGVQYATLSRMGPLLSESRRERRHALPQRGSDILCH